MYDGVTNVHGGLFEGTYSPDEFWAYVATWKITFAKQSNLADVVAKFPNG
jgi:hypothetical protein